MFAAAAALAFLNSYYMVVGGAAALLTGSSISYLMHWHFVSPIRGRRPLHKNIRRHT